MDYPIPPIQGVILYRRDVVVVRSRGYRTSGVPPRGEVTEFSWDSRKRLAFVACNTDVVFNTLITLTYPAAFPSNGKTVKKHFHAFLEWLARDLGGRPSYLWFLEFQKRGAPHYHILIDWRLPKARRSVTEFRFRLSSAWYRIVGSGDPKHLAAGTRSESVRLRDGAARYAVKYATKMRQKVVPADYRNVGRFWGCSRDVIPVPRKTLRCTEDDVRGALEGWEFAPSPDRPVYKVLYGRADAFDR